MSTRGHFCTSSGFTEPPLLAPLRPVPGPRGAAACPPAPGPPPPPPRASRDHAPSPARRLAPPGPAPRAAAPPPAPARASRRAQALSRPRGRRGSDSRLLPAAGEAEVGPRAAPSLPKGSAPDGFGLKPRRERRALWAHTRCFRIGTVCARSVGFARAECSRCGCSRDPDPSSAPRPARAPCSLGRGAAARGWARERSRACRALSRVTLRWAGGGSCGRPRGASWTWWAARTDARTGPLQGALSRRVPGGDDGCFLRLPGPLMRNSLQVGEPRSHLQNLPLLAGHHAFWIQRFL